MFSDFGANFHVQRDTKTSCILNFEDLGSERIREIREEIGAKMQGVVVMVRDYRNVPLFNASPYMPELIK